MPEETTVPDQIEFRRDEDFESLYANNVTFEMSVWDLKLIFGQLDQHGGKIAVEQHTSIAVPWVQAKLMSYFLQVNLAVYEADYGRIRIPANVVPPELPPLPPELENNPQAKAVRESVLQLREKFFSDM
jgi:hypothetical protein